MTWPKFNLFDDLPTPIRLVVVRDRVAHTCERYRSILPVVGPDFSPYQARVDQFLLDLLAQSRPEWEWGTVQASAASLLLRTPLPNPEVVPCRR